MTLRVGLVQTTTGIDPTIEAAALADAVANLARQGAQMVFTPEMSGLLDRDRKRATPHIVDETADPVLAAVQTAAAQHQIWVQLGSLALAGTDGRFANRGFLIDPTGAIRARYDKIHLFDVTLPGGETYRESSAYAPGNEAVCAVTPWGPLGLTICYDLRFPALHRALAEAGAAMLSVPAAFTKTTGEAHWHVLLRARAIETGCFVIAAAQTGTHADGRTTFGHSLVVAPWGEVLLDMGTMPGLAVCEIDLAAVAQARGKVPALEHARRFTLAVTTIDDAFHLESDPSIGNGHANAPVAQQDRATVS